MPPIIYARALRALDLWEAAHTDLSVAHRRTLAEIRARILRLDSDYIELMTINEAIAIERRMDVSYDDATETLRFKGLGADLAIPMKRKDPGTPVQISNKGWVEAYPPGGEGLPLSEDAASVRLDMGPLLECYYYNAHVVIRLARVLLGRGLECKPIHDVRNKLIEHAEVGDIYSFGNGSDGPLIRPIRPSGSPWRDDGLMPNTEALTSVLCAAFTAEANPGASSTSPGSPEVGSM